MPGLIRVARDRVVAAVLQGLRSVSGVAGAYLFGSILGPCRPDSDIDLGIVPRVGSDPFQLVGDVEAACRPLDGHFVHATILEARRVLFSFEVASRGELLYCADRDVVTDFIEAVALRYQDVGPAHAQALLEILGR